MRSEASSISSDSWIASSVCGGGCIPSSVELTSAAQISATAPARRQSLRGMPMMILAPISHDISQARKSQALGITTVRVVRVHVRMHKHSVQMWVGSRPSCQGESKIL